MEKEQKLIQVLLPPHYKCEALPNGVKCQSIIGIDRESIWQEFLNAVRKIFGARILEIFHKTCTNHLNFTVYLS
jgi:hypothetical protein